MQKLLLRSSSSSSVIECNFIINSSHSSLNILHSPQLSVKEWGSKALPLRLPLLALTQSCYTHVRGSATRLLLALALVVTAVTGQPKAMAKPSGYVSHGHTYGTRSADSESEAKAWLRSRARGYSATQIKQEGEAEVGGLLFLILLQMAADCAECSICYSYCS